MGREEIAHTIAQYFKSQPVEKAWLFGSYARGESTEESDVDILVRYDRTARISLWKIAGLMTELEKRLHYRVDLVEEGRLIPEAVENVERDKILIYERKNA